MSKIGAITIGQSPRTDIMHDILKILPPNVKILEAGALDDLTPEEIKTNLLPQYKETPFVTRLRDGSEVKISKTKILPLIQSKIKYLESLGVELITILCSGEFPEFSSSCPVLYPDKILKGIVSGVQYKGKSAVLIPAKEQIKYAKDKWSKYLKNLEVIAISPYTSKYEDFISLGKELGDRGIGFLIMDCVGYTMNHKELIKKVAPIMKIVTTRGVLARAIIEMI
ncbi:MAG: AroM family protein [Thermoprotei archaeon]